ncbi:hypothetical protein JVU11DRAFT_4578 [Chiua virens]|nr:hypothetical protein JVU11DRAFT_4578 [Chiua virens]
MLLLPLLMLSLFASNALSIPPPEVSGSTKSVVDGSGVNDHRTDGTLASVSHPHATGLVDDDEADDNAVDDAGDDDGEVDGTLASIPHPQATGLVGDNGTDDSDAADGRNADVDVAGTDAASDVVTDNDVDDLGAGPSSSTGEPTTVKANQLTNTAADVNTSVPYGLLKLELTWGNQPRDPVKPSVHTSLFVLFLRSMVWCF